MRVLAVTPYYRPEGGGLERYAHAILSRLADRGHEVDVLTFTGDKPRRERSQGLEIHRRNPLLRVSNAPVDPRFPLQVAGRIREKEPDVVVAHTPVPFPAEAAYLAARQAGVPFVTTYHAGRLTGSSRLLDAAAAVDRATFEKAMLAGSRALIAVSPFVRDGVLGDHRDRTTVVPPGVDADRFTPGDPPEEPSILFVGPVSSAYAWKGLDVLCQAFETVRATLPEARLRIVGAGDRTDEIQRWGQTVGGVELLGHVPDDELVDAYRGARVVALPSTSPAESFGMVLAEANACGRPVVGSRVGGIPSFVRDGENGLLAEPGDAEDLADKLLTLLEDPDKAQRMGRRGRAIVTREHDWDRLAEDTEQVLASAADCW